MVGPTNIYSLYPKLGSVKKKLSQNSWASLFSMYIYQQSSTIFDMYTIDRTSKKNCMQSNGTKGVCIKVFWKRKYEIMLNYFNFILNNLKGLHLKLKLLNYIYIILKVLTSISLSGYTLVLCTFKEKKL